MTFPDRKKFRAENLVKATCPLGTVAYIGCFTGTTLGERNRTGLKFTATTEYGVLVDSSPDNQAKYYPLFERTSTHNDLYYVGPREKEQFLAYLNGRLRDKRLEGLVKNLFRPSYGGNRNYNLMYTLGGLMGIYWVSPQQSAISERLLQEALRITSAANGFTPRPHRSRAFGPCATIFPRVAFRGLLLCVVRIVLAVDPVPVGVVALVKSVVVGHGLAPFIDRMVRLHVRHLRQDVVGEVEAGFPRGDFHIILTWRLALQVHRTPKYCAAATLSPPQPITMPQTSSTSPNSPNAMQTNQKRLRLVSTEIAATAMAT